MGWIQITSSVTLSNVTSSNNLSFNSYFKKPICWIMGLFRYRLLLKTENWKHYSKIIFKCVNSTIGSSFKVFFFFFFLNKVLTDPMNSTHDPLEKHNFALSSYTIAMGPTFENMKRSSQKKKKKKKKKVKLRCKCFSTLSKHSLHILYVFNIHANFYVKQI